MPISAAQSDAEEPDPRRKGRVELLAADPTGEAQEVVGPLPAIIRPRRRTTSLIHPIEAAVIGANGSLGEEE